MATFRFRAAVVLDLRLKQERAALTLRSQADARFREAVGTVTATEARRHCSQQELAALERRGSDLGAILWHRNWIDRLRGLVDDASSYPEADQPQGQHQARWSCPNDQDIVLAA